MDFINAMQNRYTTKKYDATKKIDSIKIEELKEVLLLCPSSINSQPWQFHFVSDKKVKEELAAASLFNAEKIINCDTVVVFSAIDDVALFEQQVKENLPESAINYFNKHLKHLADTDLKIWFDKQVYLALGIFLGACAQMQIDATPMEGIESAKYEAILELDGYRSLVAVAIGYRDDDDSNQPIQKPKSRLEKSAIIKTI